RSILQVLVDGRQRSVREVPCDLLVARRVAVLLEKRPQEVQDLFLAFGQRHGAALGKGPGASRPARPARVAATARRRGTESNLPEGEPKRKRRDDAVGPDRRRQAPGGAGTGGAGRRVAGRGGGGAAGAAIRRGARRRRGRFAHCRSETALAVRRLDPAGSERGGHCRAVRGRRCGRDKDRKSTRLNSSHVKISY